MPHGGGSQIDVAGALRLSAAVLEIRNSPAASSQCGLPNQSHADEIIPLNPAADDPEKSMARREIQMVARRIVKPARVAPLRAPL
jgi:hypothetical protein